MSKVLIATTKISSKGQLYIPLEMRRQMEISKVDALLICCVGKKLYVSEFDDKLYDIMKEQYREVNNTIK